MQTIHQLTARFPTVDVLLADGEPMRYVWNSGSGR